MIDLKSTADEQHTVQISNGQFKVELLIFEGKPVVLSIREGELLRKFANQSALKTKGLDLAGWEDAAAVSPLAFDTKLRYAMRVCVMS